MKYTHNNGQQAEHMERSGDQVSLQYMSDVNTSRITSFAHPIICYVQSSPRIGMRRVGGSDGVSIFSHSSKVASVNSSVLVTARPNGTPAINNTVFGFNGEHILGVKTNHIRPINNDCGEGVFYSQTKISEENCGSIQETVNQGGHEKNQSYGSTLTKVKRVALNGDRSSHSGTKDVTSTTIKIGSTGAKELRIATGFSQIFEGGSRHE
jgi:hypothetical protein